MSRPMGIIAPIFVFSAAAAEEGEGGRRKGGVGG